MKSGTKCVFCGTSTAELPAAQSVQMHSSVREFSAETFTVWRCAKCGSLHSREPIDYDRYYRHYWLKHQKYDSIAKIMLRKRIEILKRAGLERSTTLLDYGCGSGHFVRYAREHGVQAEGYDPYSEEFEDASVLDSRYDFVTAQDVLEHVDDPCALLGDLKGYTAPGGCMAIGTPNADAIDPYDPLGLAPLHQPYHRHIPSATELQRMASEGGWQVVEFCKVSQTDTRVPFINSAFLSRYLKNSGGFVDVGFDPLSSQLKHFLAHPSLIFWCLFGSFFPRKTDMVVVVRAPLNANLAGRWNEGRLTSKAATGNHKNS
jgi:2-polyprenyl-3-methyl-5-hydroxy-6-metoxy-1,4-benzoquinol methylase